MVVATLTCLVGLAAVLVALYRERPLPPPAPPTVDWEPLPTIAEVARTDFPLSFPGYDPASVEVHLDALRRAYADLLAVAPPEVVHRARRRAAIRAGGDPDAVPPPASPPAPSARDEHLEAPADDEDMRIEAVAAHLEPGALDDGVPRSQEPRT